MEWLSDWVKQIILLVMIATFFDLLLPNHSMERYVKLVMGLLIILAILSPLFQLMQQDFRLSQVMIALRDGWSGREWPPLEHIQDDIKKVKNSQDHLIQQQTEKSMEKVLIEQIEKKFTVEVIQAKIETKLNQHQVPEISQIEIITKPKPEQPRESRKIQAIEPVMVEINKTIPKSSDPTSKEGQALVQQITKYLGDYWQISPSQVHVSIE